MKFDEFYLYDTKLYSYWKFISFIILFDSIFIAEFWINRRAHSHATSMNLITSNAGNFPLPICDDLKLYSGTTYDGDRNLAPAHSQKLTTNTK